MELSAAMPNWTPVGVADTTNFTDGGHQTIQGGVGTQMSTLREVYIAGLAGASSPTPLVLGRTSTVGVTLTAGRLAPTHPSSVLIANPPVNYATSTTKPQRSATLGMLLILGLNAFGGIVRRYMGPNEVIANLGNTQPLGELSLNCFTGGTPGLVATSLVIDTL